MVGVWLECRGPRMELGRGGEDRHGQNDQSSRGGGDSKIGRELNREFCGGHGYSSALLKDFCSSEHKIKQQLLKE